MARSHGVEISTSRKSWRDILCCSSCFGIRERQLLILIRDTMM